MILIRSLIVVAALFPSFLWASTVTPKPLTGTVRISGQAALELMRFWSEASPYRCQTGHFEIPTTGEVVQTATCAIQAKVTSVTTVLWTPAEWVGNVEAEIEGPTADYLVGLRIHRSGMGPKPNYIRCSEFAWSPGRGHCWLIVEAL